MMTDTIADMLTRVRIANRVERPAVDMPATKMKVGIARVLREEGFVLDFQVGKVGTDDHGHPSFTEVPSDNIGNGKFVLRVYLKYGSEGEKVIRIIKRESRPGCRVYVARRELGRVLDGQGIRVLTTSKGIMSDRQAKSQNVGGEVLCTVW
jgi:small subunit ribosomal protein S8